MRDGVIHVEGSPDGGWLRTDRKYSDFTLRFEVRFVSPDHTGNTGLILRSPEVSISGRNWPGRGFEMELRDMDNKASMLPWQGNILALQPGAPRGRFMFDVEAVFIFPWAVCLESLGVFGLIEMLVFIAILTLGLVYAWRKGVLRWA